MCVCVSVFGGTLFGVGKEETKKKATVFGGALFCHIPILLVHDHDESHSSVEPSPIRPVGFPLDPA